MYDQLCTVIEMKLGYTCLNTNFIKFKNKHIHMYMHKYTFTLIHRFTYTHTHTHEHTHMNTCKSLSKCINVYIYPECLCLLCN